MTNLQKGLVGHWTMDDRDTSGGTLYDRSAYDNHVNLDGTEVTGESSALGQAYDYTSANPSHLQSTFNINQPYSITAWSYATNVANGDWNTLTRGGDHHIILNDNSGELGSWVSGFSGSGYDGTKLENRWAHIAALFNNGSTDFYVDGVFVGSNSNGADDYHDQIGGHSSSQEWGKLSDVRHYNRLLSEGEISALYNMRSQRTNRSLSANINNLVAHFNARNRNSIDTQNNRWYDITGNNLEAHGSSGGGSLDDNLFPEWEANNGGRFILNGQEGLNVPQSISVENSITIESWFNKTTNGETTYLSDFRNGTGSWQLLNYNNSNINFQNQLEVDDPANTYDPDSPIFDGWTHLVATSDNSSSRIYINGSEITDSRLKDSGSLTTSIGSNMTIAHRYTGSYHLSGYISVYRIYDGILSPRQVEQNYNAEKKYYK